MKKLLLTKIRLSWYLVFFLMAFTILVFLLPRSKFDAGALTLFSVNSFLYGFYIAPILAGQKGRIEELHKISRAEANALFALMLKVKGLPNKAKTELKTKFEDYIKVLIKNGSGDKSEAQYEDIITYCLEYKGEASEEVDAILEQVVANQQNRTLMTMQLRNSVYSNEWIVMIVLFSITLGFILFLDTGQQPIFKLVSAFLCTGLTMLLVILVKLSTLTHKKAKQIMQPMQRLLETHFYRFD